MPPVCHSVTVYKKICKYSIHQFSLNNNNNNNNNIISLYRRLPSLEGGFQASPVKVSKIKKEEKLKAKNI